MQFGCVFSHEYLQNHMGTLAPSTTLVFRFHIRLHSIFHYTAYSLCYYVGTPVPVCVQSIGKLYLLRLQFKWLRTAILILDRAKLKTYPAIKVQIIALQNQNFLLVTPTKPKLSSNDTHKASHKLARSWQH